MTKTKKMTKRDAFDQSESLQNKASKLDNQNSESVIINMNDSPIHSSELIINPTKDTTFYIENNLRKVRPYNFTYQTFTKQRWLYRTIRDVFSTEFQDRTPAYYEWAIAEGKISVNDELVTCEYVFKDHDVVRHHMHKHEPPVSAQDVKIVYHSWDLLVVDKPASIPVHCSGRYSLNTIMGILPTLYVLPKLYPVNRIDRLTSGLIFIALTKEKAHSLGKEFENREIRKTYIAKVRGHFPDFIECDKSIKVVAAKIALNTVDENGKKSFTSFKCLSRGDGYSIVEAKPLTGRTHQIRVHLQYLGYPILNDPLYSDVDFWAEGHRDLEVDQMKTVVEKIQLKHFPPELDFQGEEILGCADCAIDREDPKPDDMFLYLHALRYEGNSWMYETSMPEWACQTENLS